MGRGAAVRKEDRRDADRAPDRNHWLPLTAMLFGGVGAARAIDSAGATADGKRVTFEQVDPRTIKADPATFQFKSGGDAAGVTDRMSGVTKWDQIAAGKAVVWERGDGERFIADGHQRRGLALRAMDAGQKGVALDAYVMRERDGWTARDVRAYAALKNMKELSGSAVDFAKVVRERPDLIDGSLPMSDGKVRQAMNLSKLSEPAFNMVVGGAVKPEHAAAVGEAVRDTAMHHGLLTEMAKANLASEQHARLYVGQALAAPHITETTGSLFGDETSTRSLLAERAKVLDKAMTALKSDKRIFGLLEREAGTIEAAGNRLSHEANAAKAEGAGQTAALIEKLATTRGPVSSMLDKAALALADGQSPGQAARAFVREVGDTMQSGGVKALLGGDMEHEMTNGIKDSDGNVWKKEPGGSSWSIDRRGASDAEITAVERAIKSGRSVELTAAHKDIIGRASNEQVSRLDTIAGEYRRAGAMTDNDLNRVSAFREAFRARAKVTSDAAHEAAYPGWSDQARTKSAKARSAGGKVEKVTRAGKGAAPKLNTAGLAPNVVEHLKALAKSRSEKTARAAAERAVLSLSHTEMNQLRSRLPMERGRLDVEEVLHKVQKEHRSPGDRTSARPANADSLNQNHLKGTQNPNNLKAIVEGKKGRAKAPKAAADPHTPAPVKAPSSLSSLKGVQIDAMLHDMNLATSGTRAAKESRISKAMEGSAINKDTVDFYAGDHAAAKKTMAEVKAARAAPAAKAPAVWSQSMSATAEPHAISTKPPHRSGAGAKKALGLLAPVAIGAAMLSAANEAKAEGRSQTAAAAKEGAAGAGGMAVFMGGTAAATAGLVKAGMTAARAVPVVQGALMAGGALKGAWDARKGGAGAMAAGAAKGAWDMSLPGMVVNTGIAAKDAVQGRMAVTAGPSTAPASFQAASERFHAMRAAAATSDAGEKKKGWSNAARIGAYKARMAKSGANPTNMPYGGAVEPPKPLK